MKYHTMVEMAKIIGIPESTARGYRDRFPSYFSTTGQGRGKRYTEKAMEALRIVAPMSRDGIPTEDIEAALEARFGVTIESQPQIAVSQSLIVADENSALVTTFASEMTAMREQITALQAQLEARDARDEERDLERDLRLVEIMRLLTEKNETKKTWWKKFF